MATNTYETLLILDSNHYARDPGGIAKQLEDLFTEAGANVLVNRLWMERKLEYPIQKHQKGTYWLVYSEMEGTVLEGLDRALHLCEPVLRQLTLKLDDRLVEPILANARGENPVPTSATDEEETKDAPELADDGEAVAAV